MVVGSRGVLADLGVVVMFCVVRVPLLMRGYGGVLVNGTAMDRTVSSVIRAIADAANAANSEAHEPKHHTSRPNNAKSEGTFWLAVRHAFNPLPASS
jgi:hypothetical protein